METSTEKNTGSIMVCKLKARRSKWSVAVQGGGKRRIMVFKRTGDETTGNQLQSQKKGQPCGLLDCATCGIFFAMAVNEIERMSPGLLELKIPRLSLSRAGEESAAVGESKTPSLLFKSNRTKIASPDEQYKASCKLKGYDPDVLDTKQRRRMVVKSDGSEWHPHTVDLIDRYLESKGAFNLPESIKTVVENKMKGANGDAPSAVGEAYLQAIRHCEKMQQK